MWYAFNYEKAGSVEDSAEADNSEDALMAEEKWKNAWLERLERRECVCHSTTTEFSLTLA